MLKLIIYIISILLTILIMYPVIKKDSTFWRISEVIILLLFMTHVYNVTDLITIVIEGLLCILLLIRIRFDHWIIR